MKIVITICLLLIVSTAFAQDSRGNLALVTTTGEAQVNVIPDTIVVSIGIIAGGNTASEARNKEIALLKSVMDVVKKLNIDTKNIKTESLEVDLIKPEFSGGWQILYDTDQQKRYGARQMLTCTLNDIADLTPLMTGVLDVGAVRIMGVEYRTSKLRQYRDQARAMAIKAAKEKATALAAELGQSIGKAHSITENPYYGRDWYYYGSWWGYRGYGNTSNVSQNVASDSGGGAGSDDISLGELVVNAKVNVSFLLK